MTRGEVTKRAIQLTLFAVVLFFIVRAIIDGFSAVSWRDFHPVPHYVALSVVFAFVSMVAVAAAYRSQLETLHKAEPWFEMLAITWVSRAGKYIPGKVMSVAGAAYLLSKRGVPAALATSAILLNTALTVLVGLVVGAPLLVVEPLRSRMPLAWLWCAVVIVVGVVCVQPEVITRIINFTLRVFGRPALEVAPKRRHYVRPILYILLQWVFFGLSIWCLARSIADVPAAEIGLLTAASALAVTLGFLALFAPGGLGVREGVLLLVLTPALGAGTASVVTVGWRLVQTGMEFILAGVGLIMLRISERRK